MNIDPRIGALSSGKFYAFANGYDAPAVEGTLEEVETALGLRAAAKAHKPARAYLVTVTPSVVLHAGTWSGGAYTVEILAATGADAIAKARAARRGEEGRYAPRATYRARLA